MKRQIDPEFYDSVTRKIAEDNREVVTTLLVKLLYHPMTILCTIICLACVGGTLEGGTPFLIATLIGYVSSYIGIAAVALLGGALSGHFKTAPPEQYIEIVWLMSLGYRLMSDEVDLRQRTMKVEKEMRMGNVFRDGLMTELRDAGYSELEVECLRRGFIPVTVTDRCGMGFASAYKRHYDEIWRWQM